jgi:hypothetical protein
MRSHSSLFRYGTASFSTFLLVFLLLQVADKMSWLNLSALLLFIGSLSFLVLRYSVREDPVWNQPGGRFNSAVARTSSTHPHLLLIRNERTDDQQLKEAVQQLRGELRKRIATNRYTEHEIHGLKTKAQIEAKRAIVSVFVLQSMEDMNDVAAMTRDWEDGRAVYYYASKSLDRPERIPNDMRDKFFNFGECVALAVNVQKSIESVLVDAEQTVMTRRLA